MNLRSDTLEEMTVLFTICIIFFSSIINAFAGFGGGLVAVPILVLMFPLIVVSPFMNILGLLANLFLIKTFYKYIRYRLLIPLLLGNAIGAFVGVNFLILGSNIFLIKLLGIITLISSLVLFIFDKKILLKPNFALGSMTGMVSGVLSALFAIGGVPIILYLSSVLKDKNAFRSTCMTFILINCVMQTFLFGIHGLITLPVILLVLVCIPVLLLANWLGNKFQNKVSEKFFRKVVYMILIISGVILLLK